VGEQTSNRGDLDRPTFGSLFAGVGGFDLGFEAAGWEPRWQVEWDPKCQSVLARHWPNVARYGDVCDVGVIPLGRRPDDERDGLGPITDVDGRESPRGVLAPVHCITYGFPCQDLSVAGRRAGLDGDRSNLFFQAVRIIREMRDATGGRYPTFAVAENVEGLLNADGGAAMGRCLDALAEIGAVGIEWAMLDAQHFGVPQRRRRVFIVARFGAGGLGPDPLLPVREGCGRDFTARKQTGQAVAALTGTGVGTCGPDDNQAQADHLIPFRARALTAEKGQRNNGTEQNFIPFVKARRAQSPDDHETWKQNGPAPTLNGFDNGTESRAPVVTPVEHGVRRLTPRECERLMGWPDDHTRWAADGTEIADSHRYKMCGNGVAAPVAEWVARRLVATGFRDAG
jgi:DNA (cytosine-5)-methyltransferase 1